MVRVSNMNKNNIIKKHYTIVELLLVILVVGIILGIGVAGVDKVMGTSGVTGAIRNIGGRLSVARSFAVTSNQKVAVVFPMIVYMRNSGGTYDIVNPLDDTTVFSSAQREELKNKYLFRSLRVCVVKWVTDRYVFQRWCENDNWTFLPNGTYCNFYFDDSVATNNPALIYAVDMSPDGSAVSNPTTLDRTKGMPGIVFSAGGALDPQMGTPGIKIVAFKDKFNAGVGSAGNKGTFMARGLEPKSANSKVEKGWIYSINPFTGLGTYEKTATEGL